jgi:transposase InsO family protein
VNTHKNARLTPAGRLRLVEAVARGEPVAQVARRLEVSARTVWKWWGRYRREGLAGLPDRSSRPRRLARQLPRARRRQILRARRARWSSLRIARHYQLPLSTVVTIQRRLGLNRLARLEPPRPVLRYEKARPGELVHVDVKKLGRIGRVGHRIHGDRRTRVRGIGWEYVHVAIDDCTRLGYAEVLPDERGATTAAFLRRAVLWFREQGVRLRAILSDNGGNYRSAAVAQLLRTLRVRHQRTRPYRPQTNGKAERFIRTLLYEWAYADPFPTSARRTAALFGYLRFYNTARQHTALAFTTPAQRLADRL